MNIYLNIMVDTPKYAIHLEFNCTLPTNKEIDLDTLLLHNNLTTIKTKKTRGQSHLTTLGHHCSHGNSGQNHMKKILQQWLILVIVS